MRVLSGALIGAFVAASLAVSVAAGPLEDATTAYERGDYATALPLLRPLADQGDANAQVYLGIMYRTGRGVTRNKAEAAKRFHKAADQGFAHAQFDLGVMYEKGRGVAQDYVQAHKWLDLAAARFPAAEPVLRPAAISLRDSAAAKMTPAQLVEARRLAREWKPK